MAAGVDGRKGFVRVPASKERLRRKLAPVSDFRSR